MVSEQKDTSLEEISLKIISSFIREKMELEQQCDQVRSQDFTQLGPTLIIISELFENRNVISPDDLTFDTLSSKKAFTWFYDISQLRGDINFSICLELDCESECWGHHLSQNRK